jgi:peptidoglycan/xylan/chitin deacetylase (PgdA/CDA1 family)
MRRPKFLSPVHTLHNRVNHLAFWRPALRVLCYHKVDPACHDRFTVTTEQLDAQLTYLARAGFQFIGVRDLLSAASLPELPLLLSFDDGYVDNLENAQPILQRHRAKATLFVATGYCGDYSRWDENSAPLMNPTQLRQLDPEVFELALHSHSHFSFALLSLAEIERDLKSNLQFFRLHKLRLTPALAYPYGARPKSCKDQLPRLLSSLGIELAFRLGNRINRLPLAAPYEIQRIDVSGEDGVAAFRRKLWIGKLL